MLHFSNVTKQFGPRVLFREGSFQINPSERVGLVGPNGAGKTTIFRLITHEEGFDSGTVTIPDKVVVGYFSQNIEDMGGRSALEEVKSVHPTYHSTKSRLKELELVLEKSGDPDSGITEEQIEKTLAEYGNLQHDFEEIGGYDLESKAQEILTGLGIGPGDYNRPTESFSGGWKMRIALAKILLLSPDLLLMDEPTNHLDMESIIWLEEWLKNYKGALLMTSHDRTFLNRLVTKIVEVAHSRITVYSGNYDFYDREKAIRLQQLLATQKRQEDMLAKEEEFIARFAARASHAAQVQSRVKKLEKIERIEIPKEEKEINFVWPEPPRGGDEVCKIENLKKIYGENKLVFQNASAMINRLDRVAVVGVNGAGKSTLLKLIAGQIQPTEGKVVLGQSIKYGYFSQNALDVLHPQSTVLEEVQNRIPNSNLGYIRNLLGAFKFSQDEADKKVQVLSGGEKSRLVLACILACAPNFLILDEPTNHLDMTSREVLLQAIKDFPGTVIMVSHDRHFLNSITTKVFEVAHHELHVYQGSWDYYTSKSNGYLVR